MQVLVAIAVKSTGGGVAGFEVELRTLIGCIRWTGLTNHEVPLYPPISALRISVFF